MRIGIDARMYRKETGGIGRYTRGLINELAVIDKKNEYVVFLTGDDMKEWVQPAENFKAVKADIIHYSLDEQRKFGKIIEREKLDLIHYTNFNHPIFSKTPFVVTIHDLIMSLYPVGRKQKNPIRKLAYDYIMKHAARSARKVIVPSVASKEDVVRMLGAKPDDVVVTYEAVDSEYDGKTNEKIRKEILGQYKIQEPYLLFISQWRPHKGIIPLLEAYEILKEQYEDEINLVIGGKQNVDFPEIIAKAEEVRKKVGGVVMTGFIPEEDLPAIYDGAMIYVLASLYEGFCLTHLEAMAAGVPVATSNTSCMPEVLQDAAEYFDPRDPHNIARVLDKLINNKNRRDELVQLGKEQVKKYSWRKMASETLRVYEEAVNLQK
ncbi:MAG: glycosyltransferase family 1 protein [bacterium]|nr:glycosyltransferase family 1 protein [bacterium]